MELTSLAKLKGWHLIIVTGDIDINISESVNRIIDESHFACSTVFTEYDAHLVKELELIASKCYWSEDKLIAVEGNYHGKTWSVYFGDEPLDTIETISNPNESEIENDTWSESNDTS